MASLLNKILRNWLWRGSALIALALLSFQAAAAADVSPATIRLYAPGAPAGAIAAVQYRGTAGQWVEVAGWTGILTETTEGTKIPYQVWSVAEQNFGQGPFRWVVFKSDGKTAWATSDIFYLPPGGGLSQDVTIRTDNLASSTATVTIKTAVGEAAQVPVLKGGSAVESVACADCEAHAHISAYINGLPANSWFVVQWLDGFGAWQTVPGWQSYPNSIIVNGEPKVWTPAGNGTLFIQWAVMPANYGQGPFRWAVFDAPGGKLMAVSPNFNLPTVDNTSNTLYLSE